MKLTVLVAAGLLLSSAGAPAVVAGSGSACRAFSGDGRVKVGFRGAYDIVGGRDVLVTSSGKVVMVAALESSEASGIWVVVRFRIF